MVRSRAGSVVVAALAWSALACFSEGEIAASVALAVDPGDFPSALKEWPVESPVISPVAPRGDLQVFELLSTQALADQSSALFASTPSALHLTVVGEELNLESGESRFVDFGEWSASHASVTGSSAGGWELGPIPAFWRHALIWGAPALVGAAGLFVLIRTRKELA